MSYPIAGFGNIHLANVSADPSAASVPRYRVVAACVGVKNETGQIQHAYEGATLDWLHPQQQFLLTDGLVVEIDPPAEEPEPEPAADRSPVEACIAALSDLGVHPSAGAPAGGAPGSSSAPTPSSSDSTAPSTPSTSTVDPNVVATKLSAPRGIAVLADGTSLVAERTTGRILLVQAQAGQPVKVVQTLTGLDTAGGGGVLDIALSATYDEDGLVLALITTATDIRLVHFTLGGVVTPILTGIPRGSTANSAKLLVLANGEVLVGTGDTDRPALAVDPGSLAGKVLRVDDLGRPEADNPVAGSAVYASGFSNVNGLCLDPATATLYSTQAASSGDSLLRLVAGANYASGGNGPAPTALSKAIGGVGGCAISDGDLYVTGLNGHNVFRATISASGALGQFTGLLTKKYGRISNVVAAADGSLWLTTSNKDGHGAPVAADERVLHIMPSGGGGSSDA